MNSFIAIVERDLDTNLYVGYIPGFKSAHSQGETLDELQENLKEVIEMLLESDRIFHHSTQSDRTNLRSTYRVTI